MTVLHLPSITGNNVSRAPLSNITNDKDGPSHQPVGSKATGNKQTAGHIKTKMTHSKLPSKIPTPFSNNSVESVDVKLRIGNGALTDRPQTKISDSVWKRTGSARSRDGGTENEGNFGMTVLTARDRGANRDPLSRLQAIPIVVDDTHNNDDNNDDTNVGDTHNKEARTSKTADKSNASARRAKPFFFDKRWEVHDDLRGPFIGNGNGNGVEGNIRKSATRYSHENLSETYKQVSRNTDNHSNNVKKEAVNDSIGGDGGNRGSDHIDEVGKSRQRVMTAPSSMTARPPARGNSNGVPRLRLERLSKQLQNCDGENINGDDQTGVGHATSSRSATSRPNTTHGNMTASRMSSRTNALVAQEQASQRLQAGHSSHRRPPTAKTSNSKRGGGDEGLSRIVEHGALVAGIAPAASVSSKSNIDSEDHARFMLKSLRAARAATNVADRAQEFDVFGNPWRPQQQREPTSTSSTLALGRPMTRGEPGKFNGVLLGALPKTDIDNDADGNDGADNKHNVDANHDASRPSSQQKTVTQQAAPSGPPKLRTLQRSRNFTLPDDKEPYEIVGHGGEGHIDVNPHIIDNASRAFTDRVQDALLSHNDKMWLTKHALRGEQLGRLDTERYTRLAEAYAILDPNNAGAIGATEVMRALSAVGVNLTRSKVVALIKSFASSSSSSGQGAISTGAAGPAIVPGVGVRGSGHGRDGGRDATTMGRGVGSGSRTSAGALALDRDKTQNVTGNGAKTSRGLQCRIGFDAWVSLMLETAGQGAPLQDLPTLLSVEQTLELMKRLESADSPTRAVVAQSLQ